MKNFLLILFTLCVTAKARAQSEWSYAIGFEFMPHSYIPNKDELDMNRFTVGYNAGPVFRMHKNQFTGNLGLHYSLINIHAKYTNGIPGQYSYYELDYTKHISSIELSFFPGVELGKGKNKFGFGPGIITSYQYRVSYEGTRTDDDGTEDLTRKSKSEDLIWVPAFALSYLHNVNDKFSYKIEPQVQYSFDFEYFLLGVNFGLNFSLD